MKPKLRNSLILVAVAIAAMFASAIDYARQVYVKPLENESTVIWNVAPGETLGGMIVRMEREGLLDGRRWVPPRIYALLYGKMRGIEKQLKAGEYEIEKTATIVDFFDRITRGRGIYHSLTIVEGTTFAAVLQNIRRNKAVKTATEDAETIRRQLGITQPSPEGWLLPDTYHFYRGSDALALLRKSHEAMQRVLQRNWDTRSAGLPLKSPYQALILASIIEKETAREDEKTRIAAVFINRLKKDMRLQADPTVIYGLEREFDGNLRRTDMTTDTPYNTYTRKGLPPTPIAMPGRSSIYAATHPDDSGMLYFVSKGDGSHHFSDTYKKHLKAVAKYQLKRNR